MDHIHTAPRKWSNTELRKFAGLFEGDVVNVSAWRDEDKEGKKYRSYFGKAESYSITNYDAEKRGFQGQEGETFLDLEKVLPEELVEKFDVVFNHTTLEHIYDFRTAFQNLCAMSRDIVIVVVPFVQQMHADYGDFWRFTPQALKHMFEEQGLEVAYLSFNNGFKDSVYLFCIASKKPSKWRQKLPFQTSYVDENFQHLPEPFAGCNAIHSNWKTSVKGWWISTFGSRK